MLGDKEAAFAALEKAAAAGSHLDTIKLDPALDNLAPTRATPNRLPQ
jgi:hypothetical protein